MAKKQNIEELVAEQTETVTEEVAVKETVEANTHTVSDGETWVSISELYRGSQSNKAYAQELIAKNGDKLTKGAIIKL